MIICFVLYLQMFRYPSLRRASSTEFEKIFLQRHGRPYYKPYEDGDEEIRILPKRGHRDTMTYQKYMKRRDSRVYLTPCCSFGGYICARCAPLNTTRFHDVDVHLCPEDWDILKSRLIGEEGWRERDLYNWIVFWKEQYRTKNLVFFEWRSIREKCHLGEFGFFRSIFDFVFHRLYNKKYSSFDHVYGTFYHNRRAGTFERLDNDDTVRIKGFYSCLKHSICVYGNHLSLSILTTKYRSYSILKTMRDTTDPWSIYKEKEARVNFDLVRDEIDKDVSYRPLMFRYIEAREHFSALVDTCV